VAAQLTGFQILLNFQDQVQVEGGDINLFSKDFKLPQVFKVLV
jgi:hypothetical protein